MKLIICMLEGISYPLINEYMDHDLLPNFKSLCSHGNYGELKCNPIPYEASGIVTAFSGKSEYEHGIISYWNPRCQNYTPEIWSSNDIKHYMFWNHNEFKNYRYTIVNMFGTQPTYEVNGTMISYSMDKNLRFTYPYDLLLTLNKRKLPYVQDICAFLTKDTVKAEFCKSILDIDMLRKNAFIDLMKDNIDVAIVNFTQIDRFSHFYYKEISETKLEDSQIFRAYKQSDDFLGEILSVAEKNNSELIVFSEIGFGPLKKFVNINDYLCKEQLLKKDMETNKIQFDQTIAFEAVQGSHGININSKGIFAQGTVSRNEYNDVLQHVITILKDMPNPYTNNPMFKNVMKGTEYSISSAIPDIILEPYDWEYLPYGDPYWSNHVSRHYQTGWHRSNSFWAYYGALANTNHCMSLSDINNMIKKILL